jgi:hypothetical protein
MPDNPLIDNRLLNALVQSKVFDGLNFAAYVLRNLMYIRVALLAILIVSGAVLSWLYSNSLSQQATAARYTWMTWFGDTGLLLLVLKLATAISVSVAFRAMRQQTELIVMNPQSFFDVVSRTDRDAAAASAKRFFFERSVGRLRDGLGSPPS